MSALDDKLAQWRRETDVDPSPELMTGLLALAKAPPAPSKAGAWSLAKTALVVSALAVVGLAGLWLRPASPVAAPPAIPATVAPVQLPVPVAPEEPDDAMPAEKLPVVPAEKTPQRAAAAPKEAGPSAPAVKDRRHVDGGSTPVAPQELVAVPQDAVPSFPAVKVRRRVDGGSTPAAR